MSLRRLRARLDRLALLASMMPGQDRKRDRIRRSELSYRKIGQQKLTDQEEAEFLALEALFHDEDQDRSRLGELFYRQHFPVRGEEGPLTDDEKRELDELERRYPPDPNDPFKDIMDAVKDAAEKEWN